MNINIIFIIIAIIAIIFAIICLCNKIKIDNITKEKNEKILKEYKLLFNQYNDLKSFKQSCEDEVNNLKNTSNNLQSKIDKEKEHLSTIQKELTTSIENQKRLSQEAFNNYVEILENKYKEVEEEHDMCIDALNVAYSNLQLKLMRESDEIKADLDKIKATRTAAIEAQKRERELENNISFYCISLSDTDKADIAKLEALKPSLNKPRVLSMLIWQTWFQKPLKTLAANVVGINDKTGIYKITNIKTKECYIGQALNIKERWSEHAKCGLGIDTPSANKLYKSMQDYGLWNFAFELLEECPKSDLNEKERYYIDLYNSCELGFNSNKGINK